ncbi:dihydrolipoamide acetyltransferase family protein [Kribbella solani]|uniref:Dihydrolipoamide acetyltransferase component of pyruvate dehydrogenase complex n=1 Tax=Kribbella solani TaxID=236067 RepID=A0A841DZI1_9ACTN|nr:dihydrolipoamide acetyltransferase family protein [Kribbella solani]MBB5982175.1 pyruvate dehydrogenase E2 component (dihydrolipoamide acetyltransferase) [Kribbella solani]
MGVQQFRLPDVGEGLVEAEIVSWKVKPGDTVKLNDTVVEIETAKSLVELPVPFAGVITELLVPEGETVPVGTPIISVQTDSAGAEPPADDMVPTIPEPDNGGRTAVLVGYGPKTTEAKRRPRKPADAVPVSVAAAPAVVPEVVVAKSNEPAGSARVLAKPPVRKLAKDLGIDLGVVTATGPGGVITRADVESHVTAPAEAAPAYEAAPVVSGLGDTRVPVKGVQKVMAQAMVASAFSAPHVTEWITVDVSATMELVERLKNDKAFRDLRVSPLLIVAKAVTLAARRTPIVNAAWDEQAQEIVYKGAVNLGIAAATPRGLIVPNIKGADSRTLPDLCRALNELVATAREGKTQPADQAGGSFTITNVGVFGVDAGTPIINPGEAAILAFGAVRKQPWVVDDEIVPRWITTLALSFDHRLIDGEKGSTFLADVASILEDPARALMF